MSEEEQVREADCFEEMLMMDRVSSEDGSRWEKDTWPELARLAKDVPEAGIHFQGLS